MSLSRDAVLAYRRTVVPWPLLLLSLPLLSVQGPLSVGGCWPVVAGSIAAAGDELGLAGPGDGSVWAVTGLLVADTVEAP